MRDTDFVANDQSQCYLQMKIQCKRHMTYMTFQHCLTIDGGFAWQHDDDELQGQVGVLEVSEHWLDAV